MYPWCMYPWCMYPRCMCPWCMYPQYMHPQYMYPRCMCPWCTNSAAQKIQKLSESPATAFSANNLAENPQKLAESGLQGLLLSHQSECTHVSWGNLEYKAKITVLVIDKSACLVKTSWSTDNVLKVPLLMNSGLELFLFCRFPYVSSMCLLCKNILSCNGGFVLCSLAIERKQGFTFQDALGTTGIASIIVISTSQKDPEKSKHKWGGLVEWKSNMTNVNLCHKGQFVWIESAFCQIGRCWQPSWLFT